MASAVRWSTRCPSRWRWRSRATACCGGRATRAASRLTKLINAGPVQNRRGTTIRFKPDPRDFRRRRVQPGAALPPVPLQGLSVPRRRNPLVLRSGADRGEGRDAGAGGAAFPRRPARQPRRRHRRRGLRAAASGPARPTCPPAPTASAPGGSNGRSPGWRRARASCTPTATPCRRRRAARTRRGSAPRC